MKLQFKNRVIAACGFVASRAGQGVAFSVLVAIAASSAPACFGQTTIASLADLPVYEETPAPVKLKVDDLATTEYADQNEQYVPQQNLMTEQNVIVEQQPLPYEPMLGAPIEEPMHFGGTRHQTHRRRNFGVVQGCNRDFYLSYEALWITREGDENFTMSQNRLMPQFGDDLSGRYTIGQMLDCVDGVEAVFTGPLRWSRQDAAAGADLDSFFVADAPYNAASIDTFNNATSHSQLYRAKYNNYELNRRWWADNVLSTLIGLRVIDYTEGFSFDSVGTGGGRGVFRQGVENLLVGVQIGNDMFFPTTNRLELGFRTRLGIFGNFNESTTFMSNRGTTRVNNRDKDIDVAGMIEVGALGRYRLFRNVVATGGYEAWFMPGTATVANQRFNIVTPTTGSDVRAGDTVIFHGATAGIEVSF
jgi:hypothetical protein